MTPTNPPHAVSDDGRLRALQDLWRFVQDARVAYADHHAADTLLQISGRIEAIQDALATPPAVEGDAERLVRVLRGHMSGLAAKAMEIEETDSDPYAAGWCAATDHAIGCLETHLEQFAARTASQEGHS